MHMTHRGLMYCYFGISMNLIFLMVCLVLFVFRFTIVTSVILRHISVTLSSFLRFVSLLVVFAF